LNADGTTSSTTVDADGQFISGQTVGAAVPISDGTVSSTTITNADGTTTDVEVTQFTNGSSVSVTVEPDGTTTTVNDYG
jgi:hypothetical protein